MGTKVVVRIESDSDVLTLDMIREMTESFPGDAEFEIDDHAHGFDIILRYIHE